MSGIVVPVRRRLSNAVTLAYGFGSVAYGAKDAAFGTFLLIYYNQVLGLNSFRVGLVIMAALVLDAFIDPMVGVLSDRTRSRWGRRHPWMYASALPIAIGWLLLWNPPAGSEAFRLGWLFVTAVIVRSAVSCFEVPSQALTPELTTDYDERTRVTAYRYLFGWAGGLSIVLLAYGVLLTARPDYPNGLFNPNGYHNLAIASAVLMVAAILVSALGTHGEIRRLPQVESRQQSIGAVLRELFQTINNRGFLVLILAGVCAYTNQGISYALANYFYAYAWQLGPGALKLLPLTLFVGAGAAFVVAPRLGRNTSKPRAACAFIVAGTLFHMLPYVMRFAHVLPPPGDVRVMVLYPIFALSTALNVSSFILGASMMADVVEESQARTGRRNEGVFFAGSFFVQKCTSGLGIAVAGTILALAGLQDKIDPATAPAGKIDNLILMFILIYLALAMSAAFMFTRFPFGRAEHEARLSGLAAAEREGAPHITD
ncbi:MFS transporter [Sphingomonas sp.]|jgi:GPH family glycoside/pentoside/hexuronide:cation symporter|uniref:MFS transporter n=1 Tax=Sphingomonas sp. TaxID=28214 RepID=UPI002E31E4D8|nr:MFS transporter [Sphingomonas sp.]HEX4693256.1 MFS transporter [Sphingomonas sp.]